MNKVNLKSKSKTGGERKFSEAHALAILKMSRSDWELADQAYTFDGVKLTKKAVVKK